MGHPALETKPNPLYTKAMLLRGYVRPVEFELKELRLYDLADQLGRSARSVANNVNEAQSASSRRDFVNKLRIASKELNETSGMIAIEATSSPLLRRFSPLLLDLCTDLAKLLGKSIASTIRNGKEQRDDPT